MQVSNVDDPMKRHTRILVKKTIYKKDRERANNKMRQKKKIEGTGNKFFFPDRCF